jgi:hypothetical protein
MSQVNRSPAPYAATVFQIDFLAYVAHIQMSGQRYSGT